MVNEGSDPYKASSYQVEMAVGMNRLTSGNWDAAEEHFKNAEKLAKTDAEKAQVKAGLGGVQLFRGSYDDADRLLREAIKKDPQTGDAWIFLSRSKMAQGDTLAAINVLKEGRLEAPQRPDIEAVLGLVYLEWGAPSQAAMYLERAIERAPERQEWKEALQQAQREAGIVPPPPPAEEGTATEADTSSVGSDDLKEGETLIEAHPEPKLVIGGAATTVPLTMVPSNEVLNKLRERADDLVRASQLTRVDLAVLLTMDGPEIMPWPGLGDLPPDVRDHEYAEAVAVVLFAGWMQRFPNGSFYPDDALSRVQTALMLYPQVRRYPALGRRAQRDRPDIPDVPNSHYAYLEIATVVSSGLMDLDGAGNFRPDDPLSGQDGDGIARNLARAVEGGLSGLAEDEEGELTDPTSP
jgi:tetratricopeptide (TPR) repeat protein